MPASWNELGLWFVTAFLGAGLVKLIDLAASRYTNRQAKTEERINKLLVFINAYGELTELFRFFAFYSGKVKIDESGEFARDEHGKFVVERKILEPEPRFEEALKSLKGADINSLIAQKIASLRLSAAEIHDIANEIDSSGKLREGFVKLYTTTVWSIELILRDRNEGNIDTKFTQMVDALKNADEYRRELRNRVQSFVK